MWAADRQRFREAPRKHSDPAQPEFIASSSLLSRRTTRHRIESSEQIADRVILLDRVSERPSSVQAVAVSPPVATTDQIASLHKLVEDRLDGAIGYLDGGGDVADPRLRVSRHVHQRVAMVCEDGPADC